MLLAITFLMTMAVLVVVAVVPWATHAVRLKVMQGLAVAGLLLMLGLALTGGARQRPVLTRVHNRPMARCRRSS